MRARAGITLVDANTYSRQALASLLPRWAGPVREATSLTGMLAGGLSPVMTGVILRLPRLLPTAMTELRVLAQLPSSVPVVVVTDMPRRCLRLLLLLAGMPEWRGGHIQVVCERLSPERMRAGLRAVLKPDGRRVGLGEDDGALTPLGRRVLMGMLSGVSVWRLAQAQGVNIKTIHSQRLMMVHRLKMRNQHALLCGRYTRGRVSPGADGAAGPCYRFRERRPADALA